MASSPEASRSVSADEIEIVEDGVEDANNDDPFATFTEWASEADDTAYAAL